MKNDVNNKQSQTNIIKTLKQPMFHTEFLSQSNRSIIQQYISPRFSDIGVATFL